MVLVKKVKENHKTVKWKLLQEVLNDYRRDYHSYFVRVDDGLPELRKHAQAKLYPSERVTIGILFALKGVGTRAF
jgi:hypothetical protein